MKAQIVKLNKVMEAGNAEGSLWYVKETGRVVTKLTIRCYRDAEGIKDDFHFVKVAD